MQIGTDSCFTLDPGDYSYVIAFGHKTTYCTTTRGIDPSYFYALTEDITRYKGNNFSSYSIGGNLKKGTAQFNFTLMHKYVEAKTFKVRGHLKKTSAVRRGFVQC